MEDSIQVAVVLAVLCATFVLFIKEWIPTELAAMAGFATLLATGILDGSDLGSVFGNPAPVTIGAMFILSEALTRTGVIDFLAARFKSLARGSEFRALVFLAAVVIPASAFLNNTPVVVVFLPVIIATCRSTGLHATRLLIPLSFLSILGGTTTLLGTSTNLLVSGVASENGQAPFSIFEITPLGIVYALVGSLYMVFIGRHLLPAREPIRSTLDLEDQRMFYSAIQIDPSSSLVGQRLVDSPLLSGRHKLAIYQLVRRGRHLETPLNEVAIQGDDVYWVRASVDNIAQAETIPGVRLLRRQTASEAEGAANGDKENDAHAGEALVVEALIGPESSLIGKTVRRAAFRHRFGILVVALHRRGRNVREDFENIPLAFGDTLILEGPVSGILQLNEEDDILNLQEFEVSPRLVRKAPLAIAALLAVVVCSAFGFLSITSAAIVGSVLVILTRCLDMKSALGSIDWGILFLIYGMLGVGTAMEKTGVAMLAAESITGLMEPMGPYFILAAVYMLASIITELVTNNAVAIILTPIVIGIANSLGLDPRPFIVAVMFGASASFITPIGYQTNTYVYGAGNYRFRDFLVVGTPLNLTLAAVATFLIPRFWPF